MLAYLLPLQEKQVTFPTPKEITLSLYEQAQAEVRAQQHLHE